MRCSNVELMLILYTICVQFEYTVEPEIEIRYIPDLELKIPMLLGSIRHLPCSFIPHICADPAGPDKP